MKNQPKTEKRPGGTLIRMPEPEALEEFTDLLVGDDCLRVYTEVVPPPSRRKLSDVVPIKPQTLQRQSQAHRDSPPRCR